MWPSRTRTNHFQRSTWDFLVRLKRPSGVFFPYPLLLLAASKPEPIRSKFRSPKTWPPSLAALVFRKLRPTKDQTRQLVLHSKATCEGSWKVCRGGGRRHGTSLFRRFRLLSFARSLGDFSLIEALLWQILLPQAGRCFKVNYNNSGERWRLWLATDSTIEQAAIRWSSAAQMGTGFHCTGSAEFSFMEA